MARGSKSSYFVDRASVRETDAAPHALTAVSRINKPSRLCVFAVAFPFASLRLRGCFPLRVFAVVLQHCRIPYYSLYNHSCGAQLMSRFSKLLFIFTGIGAMVLLAWSMLQPRSTYRPDVELTWDSPGQELDFYMQEKADYRKSFSRVLAEKRIARAGAIAAQSPEWASKALTVVDSVKARLGRAVESRSADSTGTGLLSR